MRSAIWCSRSASSPRGAARGRRDAALTLCDAPRKQVRSALPSVRPCLMMALARRRGRAAHPVRTEVYFMTVPFWRVLSLVALLATLGFTGPAAATPPDCTASPLAPMRFIDHQYENCFIDLRRGLDINDDGSPDLGGTGHTALNFTGGAGPAGDTWLTTYAPAGHPQICGLRSIFLFLDADVLIHTYNNAKGVGLVG